MSVLREMIENLFSRPVTILYPWKKVPDPGYLPREGGEHR